MIQVRKHAKYEPVNFIFNDEFQTKHNKIKKRDQLGECKKCSS